MEKPDIQTQEEIKGKSVNSKAIILEKELLPFTKKEDMKKPGWSFIYTYNLRTVRDTFLLCAQKQKILEEDLYEEMRLKIPPPTSKWINPDKKDKKRLRLEYIHAARYLGLIKKEQNFFIPDYSNFEEEKRIVVREWKKRIFEPSEESPPLSKAEKELLIKTMLNHDRARDFLRWFLDFEKFPITQNFDESDFKKFAEPVFIRTEKGQKGPSILKRTIDEKVYKIPNENPNDYTRIAQLFPIWFKDLELIDEVIVFPRFSEDKKLWHMYYPIKMSEEDFLKLDLLLILESLISERNLRKIWIPRLLYLLASNYKCPVRAIKIGLENVSNKHIGRFYLERVPIHLVKRKYKDSYMEVEGFLRSYLKISRSTFE